MSVVFFTALHYWRANICPTSSSVSLWNKCGCDQIFEYSFTFQKHHKAAHRTLPLLLVDEIKPHAGMTTTVLNHRETGQRASTLSSWLIFGGRITFSQADSVCLQYSSKPGVPKDHGIPSEECFFHGTTHIIYDIYYINRTLNNMSDNSIKTNRCSADLQANI